MLKRRHHEPLACIISNIQYPAVKNGASEEGDVSTCEHDFIHCSLNCFQVSALIL